MKKIFLILLIVNFYSVEQLQAQLLGGQLKSKPRSSLFHLGTAVVEVTSPTTGRIWMDRNLGSQRVATSYDDQEAVGDMYQWGRGADGHQVRTSATTSTLSSTDLPGNANFILSGDWRSPQNNNLWQGVNGVNNPCPTGYRLPTKEEWDAERPEWNTNATQTLPASQGQPPRYTHGLAPFETFLKLPVTGWRSSSNGNYVLFPAGLYWTSSIGGTIRFPGDTPRAPFSSTGVYIYFDPERDDITSNVLFYTDGRGTGQAVRCIKN